MCMPVLGRWARLGRAAREESEAGGVQADWKVKRSKSSVCVCVKVVVCVCEDDIKKVVQVQVQTESELCVCGVRCGVCEGVMYGCMAYMHICVCV